LRQVHRWLALGLAPLLFLIIASGAVLALKPILGESAAGAGPGLALPQLVQALDRADPEGRAGLLRRGADGGIQLVSRTQGPLGQLDLTQGRLEPTAAPGFDLFAWAKQLHKDLLVGAGLVVEIVTFALVLVVALGPLLAWLRLRPTVIGWHNGLGWLLLPLVLMLPLTGALMALHLDGGARPALSPSQPPLTLARALERALQVPELQPELAHLVLARQFHAGAVLLVTQAPGQAEGHVVVDGAGATRLGGSSLVRRLHEGTWAGPWSGLLNLVGALATLGLMVTGLWSWLQRPRRRPSLRPA